MSQPTPYPIRMTKKLRDILEADAKKNERSLHAEVLLRLHESCDLPAPKNPKELNMEDIARRVATEVFKKEIAKAIKK